MQIFVASTFENKEKKEKKRNILNIQYDIGIKGPTLILILHSDHAQNF